ncbi:MAG TPA: IS5 family transposase [Candidatus Binatia bacterium]|nr:IS5 family transposase [Candidatus Binatia bacterium]
MRKPYRSDLTDAQWEVVKPLIPPARHGERPRTADMREVLNTLFHQARTGLQWDYLPHDLVPKSTMWDYFVAWRKDGTGQPILDALRGQLRAQAGRQETPIAACIDTQAVKTTETGGERGCDGNKKVKRRKRHTVVDTLGFLIAVAVTAAHLDDGTHAPEVLGKLAREAFPRLEAMFGDSKYNNRSRDGWMESRRVGYHVQVSSRPAGQEGFVSLRVRWVVERTFAWLGRYRRLSKDYEYETAHSEAWIQVGAIHMMLRHSRP